MSPIQHDSNSPSNYGAHGSRRRRGMSTLSMIGWYIIAMSFLIGLVLLIGESWVENPNPYVSIVTYSFTPAGVILGGALVVLSLVVRGYRRRRGLPERPLPRLDFNKARVRAQVMVVGLALGTFVTVSAVATYRAYHFTESTEFCGTVCHEVMQPEFEALGRSAHARVGCVECHIGPGAEWYVRAKFSGMRQVLAVLTGDYELPIKTPIANLRPARDTCEHCHWPAKFEGSTERVLWRYWYDKGNTPSRFHLLMKVGGVRPDTGRPEGIHWHSNSEEIVWYLSLDEKRQTIPWVEVAHADGSRTVYSDGTLDVPPPRDRLRQMDCIDCHSRPAHVFRSPNTVVDAALAAGELDPSIPYVKRNAVQLLSLPYRSFEAAETKIRAAVETRYASIPEVSPAQRGEIVDRLVAIYRRHNFPEQGVSWRTYQSNIGHKTSAGCFRCHSGRHATTEGKKISHDCETCHDFIHQAHGPAAAGPVTYRRKPFEHPGGESEEYEAHGCFECHSERVGWYPGNPDDDSIDAAPKADGAPKLPTP